MDSIENACFVSYAHGGEYHMRLFLEKFEKILNGHLDLLIDQKVYYDKKRLKPGYNFNIALSKAICKSVCMIVIFAPKYEKHPYCLREFLAMEKIEKKRLAKLKKLPGNNYDGTKRMIIPIILRGSNQYIPKKISNIQFLDFRDLRINDKLEENIFFDEKLREIADQIESHYYSLEELQNYDCNSFQMPSERDAINKWIYSNRKQEFPGVNIND